MFKLYTNGSYTGITGSPLHIQCPYCGALGTFERMGGVAYNNNQRSQCLIQVCPAESCRGVVVGFFEERKLIKVYPGIGRPINTENVPDKIKSTFREAEACFANGYYVAGAIMIRRTLEEICLDKGATGDNLFKRIKDLSSKIIISPELLEAMHELRLLGNDAAHIEANTYNEIGRQELEISIAVTQEIVKALYQHQNLVSQLKSLQKAKTDPPTASSH